MFKHALTHDVAYSSLLVQRRRELHRVIALAIEELYAERLTEQYEVLAHHFSKAEDWARALDYLFKAADKAMRSFANREALALYDQALEVAGQLGDAVDAQALMTIREAKSNAYLALSDFLSSRAEGEHLLALARRAGDRVKEGVALAGMGFSSLWAHDFDRALAESREAIEVAEPLGAEPVIAASRFTTGFVFAVTERLAAARTEFAEALRIGHAARAHVPEALSLGFIALQTSWEGRYAEGAQRVAEGVRISREHNLLIPLLWTVWISGVVAIGKGEYDEAVKNLEEHLVLCEKVGDEVMSHRVLNTLGWLWAEFGDVERALDVNRRGAEGARKRGDPETVANAEINLADVLVAQGQVVEAREIVDEVYRLVRDPATSDWMRWRYSTRLFATMGDVSLARGDHAKAREWADQCLEIATRTNAPKNLVKGWRLRGEIAMARRQWDDAASALQQAVAHARGIGNPTQLWKTLAALGRLQAERHEPEAARQAYVAAREIIDAIRGRLRDGRLRASLDASPSIQRVYQSSAPR
jgi:tetratricopeptide (TPR) repeat protein